MPEIWSDLASLCAEVRAGRAQFDCIVVLGGGVPPGPRTQLPFVANRCDAAVCVRAAHDADAAPVILCLSAGTAHMPQLLSADGLPVWEATASAAEVIDRGVPPAAVFVETTSYDTIGNAFFARVSHTDHAGWRRLLVITSAFHMDRSAAIFDWVFAAGPPPPGGGGAPYAPLAYLATPDDGLSGDAVTARAARESRSAKNVRARLAPSHGTLREIHAFLTTRHDLYTAEKLAERAARPASAAKDPSLLLSYGGAAAAERQKRSLIAGVVFGAVVCCAAAIARANK